MNWCAEVDGKFALKEILDSCQLLFLFFEAVFGCECLFLESFGIFLNVKLVNIPYSCNVKNLFYKEMCCNRY